MMQYSKDAVQGEFGTGGIQYKCDEESIVIHDRWDAGQVGCRTGGMRERRDAGKDGCRKDGMQEGGNLDRKNNWRMLNSVISQNFSCPFGRASLNWITRISGKTTENYPALENRYGIVKKGEFDSLFVAKIVFPPTVYNKRRRKYSPV